MNKLILYIFLLSIALSCSSSDDGNVIEPSTKEDAEESVETPTEPSTPETPSGTELLYNGTAIMETKDPKTPYILYNQNGVISTAIDQNLDGAFEQVILTNGDAKTVIDMDIATGLPTKMYTSENVVVIYNFKEDNTTLDIAVIQQGIETVI
ncbi:MAG: hypothetical protein ABJJ05_08090 [Maribacter litoralis]|uniref:hypothetical protein n=1 Tax=Maribacter litoralis TaxID=2059726 RepID=UPI003299CFD1